MMDNRNLAKRLIAAFNCQKPEEFLGFMAEGIVWKLVGMHTAFSKGEIRKMMTTLSETEILESNIIQIVCDNDLVSVQGVVKVKIQGKADVRIVEYSSYLRIVDGIFTEIITFTNTAGAFDGINFNFSKGTTFSNTHNEHKINY